MGLIRGGLLVIATVLLLLAFIAGNSFLTLSSSLEYENVQPELVSIVDDLVEKEFSLRSEIVSNLPVMQFYCQNNSAFVFNNFEIGQTFEIPCSIVNEGSDAILNFGVEEMVEEAYYKNYDCGFLECFNFENENLNQDAFVFISEQAKDYWKSKFYLSLTASIILIIVNFFLIEKKSSLPILVGGLLVVSSLPFSKIDWFFSLFDGVISQFLSIFVSEAYYVFLKVFILGILVLAIGGVWKLFVVGFKISSLFNRGGKQVVQVKKVEQTKEIAQKVQPAVKPVSKTKVQSNIKQKTKLVKPIKSIKKVNLKKIPSVPLKSKSSLKKVPSREKK